MQSPFDMIKGQIDGIDSQIAATERGIQELQSKIQGLTQAKNDYKEALDLIRFAPIDVVDTNKWVNKDYKIVQEQEEPIFTGRSMGR